MKKEEIKKLACFYPIVTWENNPILREISKEVTEFNDELIEFWNALIELMYYYKGVGLAAPQLGKNIRMIAVSHRKWSGKNKKRISDEVLVNPQIINHSSETILFEEACLSLPEKYGLVKRFQTIKVTYNNPEWKKYTKTFSWYNAIIIQHEIDHLDGILFWDKIVKETRIDD